MQFLIIMVLMLGVMYVLMIRPQRQRQAQQQSMIDGASVGEIANGVTVQMTRRGIAAVLPPEPDDDEDVVDGDLEDAEALDEADEDPVTDGEEAVRAAAGEVTAGDDRR